VGSGKVKSGALVPKGNIVELTATMLGNLRAPGRLSNEIPRRAEGWPIVKT